MVYERRLENKNKASRRRERERERLLRRRKPTFPGGGRAYRRIGATFRFDLLGYIGANAWCHVNPKENTSSSFFFSGFRAPVQPVTIHRVFSTCILPWPIAGIVHAVAIHIDIVRREYVRMKRDRWWWNRGRNESFSHRRRIEKILAPPFDIHPPRCIVSWIWGRGMV